MSLADPPHRRDHGVAIGLMAAALVVRLTLSWRGFYGMEATYEFVAARFGWGEAVRALVQAGHGPLNMVLIKLWALPGDGERWMMALPAVQGALAVGLAWRTLWEARGRTAALWAAGITAFSPLLLQVAISPRHENTVLLLGWAHLWAVQRLTGKTGQHPCLTATGVYGLTAWLGSATFAYWYLFMAPSLAWLVLAGTGPLMRRLVVAGVSGLLMLPMVVVLMGQGQTYLPDPALPTLTGFLRSLVEVAFGWWGGYHTDWFADTVFMTAAKGVLVSSMLASAVVLVRVPRGFGRAAAVLTLGGTALAVAVHGLRGLPIMPKYLVYLAPPLAAWLASALDRPWAMNRVAGGLLVLVWGVGLITLHGAIHQPMNNRTAVALLRRHVTGGETVHVLPASFTNVVAYYAPGLPVRGLPVDHDYFGDAYGSALDEDAAGELAGAFPRDERVWVFYGQGKTPYTDRRGWFWAAMARRFTPVTLSTFSEDNYFRPRALLVCYAGPSADPPCPPAP